jgi:Protein of unknown function (DUF3309)
VVRVLHINNYATWHVVCRRLAREKRMVTILIVLLVLLLIGSAPAWPYSRGWGYYPSGGLGLVLLIVVILMLSGRI